MAQTFAEAVSWVPVSATFSGTLGRAHEYARAQSHRFVTLEHLLLALAEDPDANNVLQASNIDVVRLMSEASAHLGQFGDRFASGEPVDPGADEALVRILDYAAAAARQSRRREINGAIVLAAVVGEARSVAATLLQAQGLTFEGAIKALQRPSQAPQSPARPVAPPPAAGPVATPAAPSSAAPRDVSAPVNGAATQTNEEILASVRRRLDASRQAKTGQPASPAPAPAPVVPPAPVRIEPPRDNPPVAEALPPPGHQGGSPADHPALPAEAAPVAEPAAEPAYEPVPAPAAAAEEPEPEAELPADIYTGTYPEVVRPPAPATADGRHLREVYNGEARVRPPVARSETPSRRPPPVPPVVSYGPLAEPPPSPLRPKRLGDPIVPPSTVPWPEPVRPQPSALPPPPPVASRAEEPADPYDGGIAGAPFPEPDSVPPRPLPVPAARVAPPVRHRPAPAGTEAPAFDQGQIVENVPRSMKVGRVETVEVRIAGASARGLADGMQGNAPGYIRDLIVTRAMSVRLRSPDGNFSVESASPETQWIDGKLGNQGGDDFASWRWNVTPRRRGPGKLQLVVAARIVAADGISADTALPDQVFDITVHADHARLARRIAGWVGLMLAGGVLSRLGQSSFDTVTAIWRGFQ